jgi:UDP-N-acetylglucosamine--N-acetylmuramyl-(pentapeptide) pyrophosphoryl-undecaprenol N-acetylglucosamine transferase
MKIIIAGGGTGGHLFPALALAEAFKDREPENEILFVGSRKGLEASIVTREGYPLETIEVASLKGRTWGEKIRGVVLVPRSLVQSWRLIHCFGPDLVLGVGGYASGPVVLTAWAMGYRTAIHEQNAFPGLSNRILGRFVDRAFLSFAGSARHFPRKTAILTGNPVRRRMRRKEVMKKLGPETKFTLFIFGGSQGAHRLNQAMEDALIHLRDLKGALRIIHQTGEQDYTELKEAYRREGFEAEVYPFIHDMDRAYAAADLVLCRAGATTLFELMAMGKPAIVVPYPYAANDHQTLNATALVDAGAALMVTNGDLTGVQLSRILGQLSAEPARLKAMGERAASLARPEAAERIVNLCYEMVVHA